MPLAAGLVHVLPHAVALSRGIWLAMHEDLRTSRPCRAAFDALALGLSSYVRPAGGSPLGCPPVALTP